MSALKTKKSKKAQKADAGYTRQDLEVVIDGWLQDRHCGLYGQAYDVFDDDRRSQCVTALADAFQQIDDRL